MEVETNYFGVNRVKAGREITIDGGLGGMEREPRGAHF